ncbi:MAG: hypothetical protein EBT17_01375 [Actinobacteria bacterium]|nr:hypothetical protein [Actinomycetota bacterium]NBR75990.1 hypothetical protein [Actinomycetota bacterium]NBT20775.1 hypothetical protein [Actinomycetota bacterium]NBY58425.1 hypothetical protein [Actinomycetota bacterium]NCY09883.1 hypothetical protein [Actinomycetota bacterium]
MSERPTRIARGAKEDIGPSTNIALVRGHLVAQPTVRVIDRHQRATTFDLATLVQGRRVVVPVVALNLDLPVIRTGDEVVAVGHVRRRFFRTGARTQSVTEVCADAIVPASRTATVENLFAVITKRVREARTAKLAKRVGD